MKLVTILSIALVSGTLAGGSAAAQDRTVKIAVEGAYAPWNFTGAGGKLEGFEIDLANNLCGRMRMKCEIVAQDWDGMIPALNARKFDAIMDAMTITDDRRKAIDFTDPYADSPNGFLVASDSPLAKMPGTGRAYNLSSQPTEAEKAIEAIKPVLKGKTIGVQVSTIQSAFADKYLKDTVDIREYKTVEQHDLDLASGRLDAVFAGATQIMGTLAKPDFRTGYALVGPSLTGGVLGGGIGIGLRKDDTELKAKFNEAIQTAIKDGTAKTLSMKWFKVDVTPQG